MMCVRTLLLVVLLFAPTVAQAEPLPERTVVLESGDQVVKDGSVLDVTDSRFVVTREAVDNANATAAVNRKLRQALERCAQQPSKSEPAWFTAVKWGSGGALVGGALALGMYLGVSL